MKSHTKPLRRKFMENQLLTTEQQSNKKTNAEKEENTIEWITFWRRNWHIYVDMVLGIKLRRFQMIMIYFMGVSDIFFAICSRGLSKSFIAGLGAICKMNLYPYSEVVITSSTIPQANKLVEDKIRDELIKKLSPYLLYLYDHEYLILNKSDDGYKLVNTLNGSILRVLPCLESSRGPRATFLIYEEARLLKKTIIDSVFEKMAHPRQAKYMTNPEYMNNPRWQEECQSIYITSARYKFEWFWRLFKTCVTGYYTDKKTRYNIFAGDIFMSIDNGLKTWGDYRKAKKMSSEMDFRMEDLNEMVGESEDAFFTIKSFKENQILEKCFRPLTTLDILMDKETNFSEKEENEIRLIISDFAFVGDTGKEKNDKTVILCMSLHWKKFRFERHIDYIEAFPGGDALKATNRIREIFWDYEADYYIPDLANGGEVVFNYISMPWEHPERGHLWNPTGFTVITDDDLNVLPSARLEELRAKTVDKNALPCIIPMKGLVERNSDMWVSLKKNLESNLIKFLIDTEAQEGKLEESGEYFTLSAESLVDALLPYGQTDELINECINLKTEYRDNGVRLSEPRSGYKDRAVCLNYGNYIASKFENRMNRYLQDNNNEDWEDVALVW